MILFISNYRKIVLKVPILLFSFVCCCLSLTLYADVIDLTGSDAKVYSQNGEDGVIQKIFEIIGTTNKFYVEFGGEFGEECNTHNLREQGWKGLLMDGKYERPEINLQREYIYPDNINSLFAKYEVPNDFDLLSIDIDTNDFYVWQAISEQYRPRVVVIEYNATHLPHEDKVITFNRDKVWDYTNYYGASILSMYHLGRTKGYSLVYAEKCGVNLFFVRDEVVRELQKSGLTFANINNVQAIYKAPNYGYSCGPNNGHAQDPFNRPYRSSIEILCP